MKIRLNASWTAGLVTLALVLYACGSPSLQQTPTAEPALSPTPTQAPATAPTAPRADTTPTAAIATASPTPVAAPDAVAPPQRSTEALVAALGQQASSFLVTLTEDFSPRESATEEEAAAAEFLLSELRALGLEAELQPFTVELFATDPPIFSLTSPEVREIRGIPMTLSGFGRVTGALVGAGKALREEVPAEGFEGKIAFIERGTITFEQKVSRVSDAGAIGAVIYNNQPGLFRGRLANEASLPAISISREDGEAVKGLMGRGGVTATISVVLQNRDARNVVAEIPGTDENGGVVVLGGHYDTVSDTQGATDNGSGIATLVTTVRELSNDSYPFTLRIIAFGAEEVGLFGSRFYVDSLSPEDRSDIVAMLNFDAVGSGEFVEVIGSPDLVEYVLTYGLTNDLKMRRGEVPEGAASDHSSFEAVGIPVLFFVGDDISRINSPDDTIEFVEPELMGTAAALGLAMVESLSDR